MAMFLQTKIHSSYRVQPPSDIYSVYKGEYALLQDIFGSDYDIYDIFSIITPREIGIIKKYLTLALEKLDNYRDPAKKRRFNNLAERKALPSQILKHHYGFDGYEKKSRKELASYNLYSEENMRVLLKALVEYFRKPEISSLLQDYLADLQTLIPAD